MCPIHKHEQWISDLPPPASYRMGSPRMPPSKNSIAVATSASNVIDLVSNSKKSSNTNRNLAASFEDAKDTKAKTTSVDVMLKAAQHRSVSSHSFDHDSTPWTVESADRFALRCYLSHYSHLVPTSKTETTAATKTTTKKNDVPPAKKKRKRNSAPPKKTKLPTIAPKVAAANEVIDVDEDALEGILKKPPPSKSAGVWEHYQILPESEYPDKKDKAVCYLCFLKNKTAKFKEISIRGGSTGGLRNHLQRFHLNDYEKMMGIGTSAFTASKSKVKSQMSLSSIFPKKEKDKSADDVRTEYINAVTVFIMTDSQPLNIVQSDSFRDLFNPFHKDAEEITKLSPDTVKANILHYGKLAEKAIKIEIGKYKVSWTTDHWTGKDGATYQTITCHYIDDDWNLCSCMIDFKVFSGSTTGKLIYEDVEKVFEDFDLSLENLSLGVTDTTASMGTFGKYLREQGKGKKSTYCADHQLQCNAGQAFHGK